MITTLMDSWQRKVKNEMVRKESTRNTKHLSKGRKGKRNGLSSTDTRWACILIDHSAAVRHFPLSTVQETSLLTKLQQISLSPTAS